MSLKELLIKAQNIVKLASDDYKCGVQYEITEGFVEQAEQLTATQQALDSSCQTNQILVKRLRMAEEALWFYGNSDNWKDNIPVAYINGDFLPDEGHVSRIALNNIKSEWIMSCDDFTAKLVTENSALKQKLDTAVEALNSLVGSDGCIGWVIGHDTIKDALLIRGGRLPIESFHPNFQVSLREVIEAAQKAKAALATISKESKDVD